MVLRFPFFSFFIVFIPWTFFKLIYLPGFLGDWTFIVNGRKRSYVLHAKLQEEAIRWANAIQEVCVTVLKTIMCFS